MTRQSDSQSSIGASQITTTMCQVNIRNEAILPDWIFAPGQRTHTAAHLAHAGKKEEAQKRKQGGQIESGWCWLVAFMYYILYKVRATNITSLPNVISVGCSASVTETPHQLTSPPTEQSRKEHMTVFKSKLIPQTKLNNPQREHYCNNTCSLLSHNICSSTLTTKFFPHSRDLTKPCSGVHCDLITEALGKFVVHVIEDRSKWETTKRKTSTFLFPCRFL